MIERWRGAGCCQVDPPRREATMMTHITRAHEQVGASKATIVILVCVAAVKARAAPYERALAAREV